MSYKALYLTYRPQTFDEVAGQKAIVRTLKNALTTGKMAHAYLFAGPRGTGKTTMRMLLAPREEVLTEAENLGIEKHDAELLAYFCNSGELIALECKEEDYADAKSAFEASLEALAKPRGAAIYAFEKSIIPTMGKKEDARYYLDMLSLAYKDLISLKENRAIALTSYATLLGPLSQKLPHLGDSLLEIMRKSPHR